MFKGHVNTGLARWAMATLLTGHLSWRRDGAIAVGTTGMGMITLLLQLVQDMLLAAVPALGFAMVFNVPNRALRYCALLGAIGHGSVCC